MIRFQTKKLPSLFNLPKNLKNQRLNAYAKIAKSRGELQAYACRL